MTILIEFVLPGTPVSVQARRRRRVRAWAAHVRERAKLAWPADAQPAADAVSITITHFFGAVPIDLDNLPKPILDAIKGVVIFDDAQVAELIVRKRAVAAGLGLVDPSPLVASALATHDEFVHVVVSRQQVAGR